MDDNELWSNVVRYKDGISQKVNRSPPRKGSIASKMRMRALEFDPMERLVDQFNKIDKLLNKELENRNKVVLDSNGEIKRPSNKLLVDLLTLQQKTATELMPYAYTKQPNDDNKPEKRGLIPLIIEADENGSFTLEDLAEDQEDEE